MRIALDARLTYYTQGGISQYIRALAAQLPALDPHNEYLVLHARKAWRSLPMPVNARRMTCWTPAHHRLERLALSAELARRRIQLLHSPDFIPPLGGSWRAVITIHDLTFLHYPQFLTPASRRYYNDQIEAAVRRADAILADSEATRQDILNLLPVQPADVTTVHLAPEARFAPQSPARVQALCERLDLPAGYLLFVGTFEPRKNIPGLLRAYAALRATLPDAPPLMLAGNPGWLFDEVDALLDELGLRAHVHIHASFPAAELPALYAGASALVLVSHYEGFGLPVLEAMACSTPAIIADRASLPEIAGDAALRCDPDDVDSIAHALQRILTDSVLHATLREIGLARVKEFSWEKCCKETLAVYRNVMRDT